MFWAFGGLLVLLGLVVVENLENHENTFQTMFWAGGLLVLLVLGVVDAKISKDHYKNQIFQTMFWAGGLLVLLGLGVVDAKITVNGEWSPW